MVQLRSMEQLHVTLACVDTGMESIVVDLDGVKYPSDPQGCNFNENNYSAFYQQFMRAVRVLKGHECAISSTEYKDLYTILAVDCSCKPQKARNAGSNITITIKRNEVPADDTVAIDPLSVKYYILSLSEKCYKIDCVSGIVTEEK